MSDLIAASGFARTLLMASFAALVISEVSIRVRGIGRNDGTLEDRGSILAVVASIGVGGLVAGWCAARVPSARIPGTWLTFAVAVALIWSGILLRQWAVQLLGRFFTVVVRVDRRQQVVDRGPYRWVRHPSYTALLLTFLGIGLAMGNWISLAALVILPTVGLVVRIRVEEQVLLSSLDGYREYAVDRPRLIPGVW